MHGGGGQFTLIVRRGGAQSLLATRVCVAKIATRLTRSFVAYTASLSSVVLVSEENRKLSTRVA